MMKVTIAIPIYNAEKYLKEAIQSVLNQTYSDFELILLNDGSKDGSLSIIEEFEKKDSRIKIVNDGQNRGLIYRLNQLIDLATGEYYVRMDADDIMFPERVEKQLKYLESNPNIDLVHSFAVSINLNSEIIGVKNNIDNNAITHPTVMAKKEFFSANKYEEGYFQMEDFELWYRTKNKYNFYCIQEPLLFYREDGAKISLKHKKMYLGLLKFCKNYKFKFFQKAKIIFYNKIKYLSYLILEELKLERILINKRFEKLSDKNKKEYLKILKFAIGRI